ncbi:hypothetical protein EYF80_047434 [Liparis tanakae]|uniref:Uncharacterized protein n=1 Tax=Liparis tanakae TaxID=230148 RepID=A0A4Z2FNM8_9TELE|nr:hypothetical protein EYF80_047434 [Liparis tanakae]
MFAALLCGAVALVLYVNTLDADFCYDDRYPRRMNDVQLRAAASLAGSAEFPTSGPIRAPVPRSVSGVFSIAGSSLVRRPRRIGGNFDVGAFPPSNHQGVRAAWQQRMEMCGRHPAQILLARTLSLVDPSSDEGEVDAYGF